MSLTRFDIPEWYSFREIAISMTKILVEERELDSTKLQDVKQMVRLYEKLKYGPELIKESEIVRFLALFDKLSLAFHTNRLQFHESEEELSNPWVTPQRIQTNSRGSSFGGDNTLMPTLGVPSQRKPANGARSSRSVTRSDLFEYIDRSDVVLNRDDRSKLMAQWDSSAKSYSVGSSMNGGLYCNDDGELSKPFSDKDYCVDGTGTVQVNNKASSNVAFCQTVLPGNEAMLIPTNVDGGDTETLAVPDESYYASSAAHYYINPLGVSTDEGCVWGTKDKSVGNWAPYVAGANTDSDGRTFLKIGWNPKYIDDFKDKPSFGIRITCDGNDCDDNSCEIDPSKDGYNGISGGSTGKSLGASYCVVTAKDKKKATIEVFSV
ncbi:hypothetical protein ACNR90_003579 [Candidozyma auris]